MASRLLTLVCCFVGVLALPLCAQAQTSRPERPYRGLFASQAANREPVLTLNVAAGAGWETNVFVDPVDDDVAPPQPTAPDAAYGSLAATLNYSRPGRRGSLAASASTNGRYYSAQSEFLAAYSGAIGGSLQVGANTRVNASQAMSYQPFLTIGLFPALVDPNLGQVNQISPEQGTVRSGYRSYQSSVNVAHRLARRTSLGMTYGFDLNDFAGAADYSTHNAKGHIAYSVGRGLGVRAGYGIVKGSYPDAVSGNVTHHNIDIGVDYSRSLSFSRRTTFSFGTGVAAVREADAAHYRLIGNARLNHEIGRSWNALAAYSRDVGFFESFSRPFFADSLSLGLTGLINRRLQFRSNAYASMADMGFGSEARGFTTFGSITGVTIGLNRTVGVGVEYSNYRYSFDAGALLPTGLPRDMHRHGAHVYLTFWTPLLSRERRP